MNTPDKNLANTGVTKAGYLLKKNSSSQWRTSFVVLNDHCLSYCSENNGSNNGNLLLTSCTKVCHEQDDDKAVIRIETGVDVQLFQGQDDQDVEDWTRVIRANIGRLAQLARANFRVKRKGRTRDLFLLLHRECITAHRTASNTANIVKTWQLTESSSFNVTGESIQFKSVKGSGDTILLTARNDIELQHWIYALDLNMARLRKVAKVS